MFESGKSAEPTVHPAFRGRRRVATAGTGATDAADTRTSQCVGTRHPPANRSFLRTRVPESPRSQDDTPRTGADPPRIS